MILIKLSARPEQLFWLMLVELLLGREAGVVGLATLADVRAA